MKGVPFDCHGAAQARAGNESSSVAFSALLTLEPQQPKRISSEDFILHVGGQVHGGEDVELRNFLARREVIAPEEQTIRAP